MTNLAKEEVARCLGHHAQRLALCVKRALNRARVQVGNPCCKTDSELGDLPSLLVVVKLRVRLEDINHVADGAADLELHHAYAHGHLEVGAPVVPHARDARQES